MVHTVKIRLSQANGIYERPYGSPRLVPLNTVNWHYPSRINRS